ncbi:MAG: penicillin-binding protein 2 [Sciscionella sp.]|nr:penicillin-binding protein 2 [Sciscionella sp.]
MNKPLRRVGLAIVVMIVLLLANATYIQVIRGDDYRNNPLNQRVLLDEYSRQRGQIITADGQPVAGVKVTNDRLHYLRTYANGPVYAPVTGYYSVDYGSTGIEHAEDEVLNGSDDRLFVRRLSDLITGRDPSGGTVQLTIDSKTQLAAYQAMSSHNFTGAVVAMKPDDGEILAMASTPSFDPNLLATHNGTAETKAKTQLDNDSGDPLENRAISDTEPPGSTFKTVVSATALSAGDTKDTQLPTCATVALPIQASGMPPCASPSSSHATLSNFAFETCPGNTMEQALAYSCNTAFATLAGQVGRDKLLAQAGQFGIGQTDLKIPLPVAASSLGDIPDQAALNQSGIGQRDVRLTPLQDCMVAATIANGGTRMQPQLVKQLLAPDLSTLQGFDPTSEGQAISPAVASTLTGMMQQSEQHTKGDGKRPDIVIASKTGTAEHGANPKQTPPDAWYIAFAPADHPKIAVAVMVLNGGDRGLEATGSSVAAGVGRSTINAYLGGG